VTIRANQQNEAGTQSIFVVFAKQEDVERARKHLLSGDCAMQSCTGYWAYWAYFDEGVWLIVDVETYGKRVTPEYAEMLRGMHGRGEPLPSHVHLFDRDKAGEAFRQGIARWGVEWWGDRNHDATRDDLVIQLAVLGEERYG
jgi:hypothetical protein